MNSSRRHAETHRNCEPVLHDEAIPTVKAIAVPLALRDQRPAAISVIYVVENADAEAVGARLTASAAAIRAEMGQ